MKVRQDFVTNSSSVSYIITMHKPMVDAFLNEYRNKFSSSEERIVNLLYDDLLENGTRNIIEGTEIYTKKVVFRTDGDTMFEDSYDQHIEKIDFNLLKDQEIWALLYGEYIEKHKITQVDGFGITRI